MAKDRKSPSTGAELEEMTVMVFRYKGSGETLRKGVDTVSQAIAAALGGSAAPVPVRRLANGVDTQRIGNGSETTIDGQGEEVVEETLESENGASNGSEPRAPGVPRKYWTPEYLTDFNLTPEGKPAWKDYAAEKRPQTEVDKYMAAAAWLTDFGSQPEFKVAHVFTLFRAMEWKLQKDVSQPLRGLKEKEKLFRQHW